MEVAPSYELCTNHTFSCLHELPSAGASVSNYPLSPSNHSPPATTPSRKRRAFSDLVEDQFSHFDGWKLLPDEISVDVHNLPPLINGGCVQDPAALVDGNHAPNLSLITASHNSSYIEDILNFLWKEDDTESTAQSASSALAYSDQISLISDLDWDYGAFESSSTNQGDSQGASLHSLESDKEGLLGRSSAISIDDFVYEWDKSQEKEVNGSEAVCNWQLQETEAEVKPSCQQKKEAGEIRPSWQDEFRVSWQKGSRDSWQLKREGSRTSWGQPEQGETRASWQPKQGKEGDCVASREEGRKRGDERAEGAVTVPMLPSSQRPTQVPVPSLQSSRSGAWAGPTLLDIESALAFDSCDSPNSTGPGPGPLSSVCLLSSPSPLPTPKHSISPFFDIKKLLSDDPMKSTRDQANLDSSWRLKLQKRSSLEPKYSVRVESEEKALGDGYRWRKYGQKTIKNSPFPRSYYKCSSGKCNAKKQVEKCHEDGALFLITYEGIHLHHKPNPLHKFRALASSGEEKKDRSSPYLSSPSSSTSCSFLNPASSTPFASAHRPLLT